MSTRQVQQFDKSQKQKKKRPWPPRGLWVILAIVVSVVIASAIATPFLLGWLKITPPTAIFTAIIAIVGVDIAFIGVTMAAFQWLYPKPANEPEGSAVTQPAFPQPSSPNKGTYRGIAGLPPATETTTTLQRETVVEEVYDMLTRSDVTALVVTGIGGIGKSTLASLVYHHAEEQRCIHKGPFEAEALWLKIDATVTLADIAGSLCETLGKPIPDFSHLTPQNQAAALFHALNTVDKARLIVLDQFESLLDAQTGCPLATCPGVDEWVEALNSYASICKVFLTSRLWPQGTHPYLPTYMREYNVKRLEIAEGITLLRKRGVKGTDTELRSAVERCKGHALALTLLISILLQPNQSLSLDTLLYDHLYAQLWRGRIALQLLDYIFMRQLNQMQRKLLFALSVYREAVPLEAAQALIDFTPETPKSQLLPALDVLLAHHLLQATGQAHYQPHTIVADYAHEHTVEGDEEANKQILRAAHARAAQYYENLAAAICPPRKKRRISDVHPLIEAVWQLCKAEEWQKAYDLILREGLFIDLQRWGGSATLLELYQLLLDNWRVEGAQAANLYNDSGEIYNVLGQKKQAQEFFERALGTRIEIGDRTGEGITRSNLGSIYSALGQKKQAGAYYEQALSIFRGVENRGEEGKVLNNLGTIYQALGQFDLALTYYEQALVIHKKIEDRGEEGRTLNNMGGVYADLERQAEAQKYYERALRAFREAGDRSGEATTLNNLGVLYRKQGRKVEAQRFYEQALSIFREIGNREEEGIILNNLGHCHSTGGQRKEASKFYGQALSIFRELKDRNREGATLEDLGMLFFEQQRKDVALACFWLARGIFREIHCNVRQRRMQMWIEGLRRQIEEQEFVAMLAWVESQSTQIIEQALHGVS